MADGDDKYAAMLSVPDSVGLRPKQRFLKFNQSPLARQIIVFNLVALGILVSGVLYLNQADDSRVNQRRADMLQQAQILAAAISPQPDHSEEFFDNLATPINAIVRLYDAENMLLRQKLPQNFSEGGGLGSSIQKTSMLTDIMQSIWQSLTARPQNSAESAGNLLMHFDNLVDEAVNFPDQTHQSTFTSSGDLYVAVAAPITRNGRVDQIVLISTLAGEIDAVIREEREQILQIFILAILVSIVLSVVLANSIARPLSRLADAAETAHANAGTRLNPAQIQIPDLTARPDEIGDLSRAMRKMIEALFDRIDENKNFAADVAHEIKNPLTSLRSAVETLGYQLAADDRNELHEVIRADVDRLDRLVTDIANASRLEGELVRDVWTPVDLGNMLKRQVEYHNREREDITITCDSDNDDFVIIGLEGRLAQVFTNLITNAISFVPPQGWIKITLDYDGPDMIEIRVTDNGPGIPEANLADIFGRFYSERPAVQFGEHSGLGLAISKQIIEVHNGTITAENVSPQGGAQFIVRLPA